MTESAATKTAVKEEYPDPVENATPWVESAVRVLNPDFKDLGSEDKLDVLLHTFTALNDKMNDKIEKVLGEQDAELAMSLGMDDAPRQAEVSMVKKEADAVSDGGRTQQYSDYGEEEEGIEMEVGDAAGGQHNSLADNTMNDVEMASPPAPTYTATPSSIESTGSVMGHPHRLCPPGKLARRLF
jgi:hypothetical protein